jgi:hypothetical protein
MLRLISPLPAPSHRTIGAYAGVNFGPNSIQYRATFPNFGPCKSGKFVIVGGRGRLPLHSLRAGRFWRTHGRRPDGCCDCTASGGRRRVRGRNRRMAGQVTDGKGYGRRLWTPGAATSATTCQSGAGQKPGPRTLGVRGLLRSPVGVRSDLTARGRSRRAAAGWPHRRSCCPA